MTNFRTVTDPTAEAVAEKLDASGLDTALALAKVLGILGSSQTWDGDTLQALADDVLIPAVNQTDLPAINTDQSNSVQFWSEVSGIDYDDEDDDSEQPHWLPLND